MNIDDIKRNINARGGNPSRTNLEPPSLSSSFISDLPGAYSPKGVQKPFVDQGRPEPGRSRSDRLDRLANKIFDPEMEEEDIVPNSKTWEPPGHHVMPQLSSTSKFIRELSLDDPEDDWRVRTSKGRRSHRNFTHFLVETI